MFNCCLDPLKNDPSGFTKDFKGFTSHNLSAALKDNPSESRKEYLLKIPISDRRLQVIPFIINN